jgi:hypothetical protein
MHNLHQLRKKLIDDQFVNFLVEKRVSPTDLISLAMKINNTRNLNEGIFGGIGGALSGLYHGWKSGYGSKDITKATEILKNQLDFAYRTFKNSLVKSTGDEATANKILDNLRKNSDIAITKAVSGETTTEKEYGPTTTSPTFTPVPAKEKIEAEAEAEAETETEVPKKPRKPRKPKDPAPIVTPPDGSGGPPIMSDPTGPAPLPADDEDTGEMTRTGELPEPEPEPEPEPKKEVLSFKDKEFLMNLREFIDILMKKLSFIEQKKLPFSVLTILKRLYRFGYIYGSRDLQDLHKEKNVNKIGSEEHEEMLKKIVEIFTNNSCDFSKESLTNNLIRRFEYYEKNHGLTGSNLNKTLKEEKIWKNLFSAIDDTKDYLNSFCIDNPDKCGEELKTLGAAGQSGVARLLNSLEEAKLSLTFKNWLLIKENILF